MALQQFGKKIFVDWNFAGPQRLQLLLVVVDQNDVVSEIGKTSPGHQSNIARTHHRNVHWESLRLALL